MSKQLNWAAYIAGQAGVVPVCEGIPGVAKTAGFEALAEATGRRFVPYMLSQMLPEDLGGFPSPDELTILGQAYRCIVRLKDEARLRSELEPTVMLFDELTCANQAVQAAALQILNTPSPNAWRFAAANPVEMAAAGTALAPPMVNRLCLLEWQTPIEDIRAGWRNGLQFPKPDFPVLPDSWGEHLHKWGCLMDEFSGKFPDVMEVYPKSKSRVVEPYPTPRSWTNVIRLLAAAESVGANKGVSNKLILGCVGTGAGMQFQAFLDDCSLPSPEEILADPRQFKLPARGDLAMAMIRSVNAAVEANNTAERWESLAEFWGHVWGQSKELAMACQARMLALKPDSARIPKCDPAWVEYAEVRNGMDR